MKSPDFSKLEAILGYTFGDHGLITLALTHKSVEGEPSNERLEFLGDRVLGMIIAEWLYRSRPGSEEGVLAVRLNGLVRRETLTEIAQVIDLGTFLRLAKGEAQHGGRAKPALLADAMEAVVAAVYLDGGLEAARTLIHHLWHDYLHEKAMPPSDAKTALQETAVARGLGLPVYKELSRTGPDHAPSFEMAVALTDGRRSIAQGGSKRIAEQQAARLMLKQLEETEGPD